jgi:ribosomal protein S6--L-glutamate ligase
MWAVRRCNPRDWRTNISRGARAEPAEIEPQWADLARRAADAVGAPVAGVDLLPARGGGMFVLEVNAVPGWQALSRTLDVDVARHVLVYLETLDGAG